MKKLRDEVLALGDVILTTTNEPLSKAIRKVTKSDISHAMVYVDPCSVIDATGEGVHARNTQRMFFPEDCAIHVLRPTIPLMREELEVICSYVRGRVGTEYSKREAAASVIGGLNSWSAKQFVRGLSPRHMLQSVGSSFLILTSARPKTSEVARFCARSPMRRNPLRITKSSAGSKTRT